MKCAIAPDLTLAGTPRVAGTRFRPMHLGVIERFYGKRFGRLVPIDRIRSEVSAGGPGARGIVYGRPNNPKIPGHVFNVVNQKGVVRFLDGQIGGAARLSGYRSFSLLRTN